MSPGNGTDGTDYKPEVDQGEHRNGPPGSTRIEHQTVGQSGGRAPRPARVDRTVGEEALIRLGQPVGGRKGRLRALPARSCQGWGRLTSPGPRRHRRPEPVTWAQARDERERDFRSQISDRQSVSFKFGQPGPKGRWRPAGPPAGACPKWRQMTWTQSCTLRGRSRR